MKTRCISHCVYDYKSNKCKGCHRTLEEIQKWPWMTEQERENVLKGV